MTDHPIEINEFKIHGFTIEKFSILYSLFLIFFGIFVSLISKSGSITSYIPSFLGIPILIFSFLSIKFQNKKRIFMHLVVIVGLLIFFGGLDVVRNLVSGNIFQNLWADISKLIMLISSLYFNIQCFKSFIHARKNKN